MSPSSTFGEVPLWGYISGTGEWFLMFWLIGLQSFMTYHSPHRIYKGVTGVLVPETCYRSDTRWLLQGLMHPVYISSFSLLFYSLYHRIHAHRDRYRITFLAKDARQTWLSGPQCEAFETELLVCALSRWGSKTHLLLEIIPDIIAQSNGLRFLTFGRNIRPYLSAWKMIRRLLSSQSFRNSTAKEFGGIFILSSTRGVTIKRMKDWVFVWISLEFEWSEWVIEVAINC
jgi:hypothetical protein